MCHELKVVQTWFKPKALTGFYYNNGYMGSWRDGPETPPGQGLMVKASPGLSHHGKAVF